MTEDIWIIVYLKLLPAPFARANCAFNQEKQTLICKADHLVFPFRDGIPVLLESEARPLESENDEASA